MSANVNSFKLEYKVTNTSADEVVVKVKGGLAYIIKSSAEATFREDRYLYVTIANVYLENLMINEGDALTKLDKKILSELAKEQQNYRSGNQMYYKDLPNSLQIQVYLGKSLVEENNALHSELLGITLYLGKMNINSPALNSPKHLFNEQLAEMNKEMACSGTLSYVVYVNDPRRVSKPLYTNALGKSHQVPILYDDNRKPGLYVGISCGIEPREVLYYTFEDLEKPKLLEGIGIFETKAACDEGGNTERYLSVERRNKDLIKDIDALKKTLEATVSNLEETEFRNARLVTEIDKVKADCKNEITQMKIQHQLYSDMTKHEHRLSATVSKANIEMLKNKGAQNTWGDFAKAVGTLAGVAFTGYKLLTS